MRHDLYLLPNLRELNLRLRWERNEDENNLLSSGEEKNRTTAKQLFVKSFFSSRYLLESELEDGERTGTLGGVLRYLVKVRAVRMSFTLNHSVQGSAPNHLAKGSSPRRWQALELSLSTQVKRNEEKMQRSKADFFSLAPQVSWSLFSSGRLGAQFKWTHLSSSPADKSLSYQVSEGKRRGENYDWRFHLDYRLNRYLASSVLYTGEKEPGSKPKHTGRMEVKAYF
jgi:hypothetical protein